MHLFHLILALLILYILSIFVGGVAHGIGNEIFLRRANRREDSVFAERSAP